MGLSIEIGKDHKVFFDDFRNVKLGEEADMVFADPPYGTGFKGNLQTYHQKPDPLSYEEVPREEYLASSRASYDSLMMSLRLLEACGCFLARTIWAPFQMPFKNLTFIFLTIVYGSIAHTSDADSQRCAEVYAEKSRNAACFPPLRCFGVPMSPQRERVLRHP